MNGTTSSRLAVLGLALVGAACATAAPPELPLEKREYKDAAGKALGLLFGAPPESTGVGTIIWLGVAAGQRGGGIGTQLMQAAFAAYRERGCHKVKIYTETEAAKAFYVGLGMEVEGFHPRHWWQVDFWALGRQV